MQLIEVFEDTGRESPGEDQVWELILLSLTMIIYEMSCDFMFNDYYFH